MLSFNNYNINLTWAAKTKKHPYLNFGDELSYHINKFLFPNLEFIHSSFNSHSTRISSIGTILHNLYNGKILVWGTGMDILRVHPNFSPQFLKIFAIRGKKTKEFLNSLGIQTPDVFGDPAILLKKYINIPKIKKYRLGIIPHCSNYYEADNTLQTDTFCFKNPTDNKDILICPKTKDDIFSIINKILECETILSESIHGCIIADTFNIPNLFFQKRGDNNTTLISTSDVIGIEHRYDDYISVLDVNKKQILHDPNLPLNCNKLYEQIITSYENIDFEDLCSNLQKNHPLNSLELV